MTANSTSFKKGQSGNPAGKPRGTRHRTTRAIDDMLAGDAEKITRKAIDMACEGDTVALRLCLDRLAPARKDRPIRFALPHIEKIEDLSLATSALLSAVAEGELTPMEAAEMGKLVEAHIKAIEVTDLNSRLEALENARP